MGVQPSGMLGRVGKRIEEGAKHEMRTGTTAKKAWQTEIEEISQKFKNQKW